ncbi:ABC-three component system middle component 6 [Lysinibacillus fusiformis]|uniref:ABC-three component system middle component 6 n=1 Tax=Lysinibacillus fusiformis TaxID=28031 RepID=UPI0037F14A7C
MLLIDQDSKPSDTVLYLSALLLPKIKEYQPINIAFLDNLYQEIDSKQPEYKYNLSLSFLFLMGKIKIEDGELLYVS